MAETRTARLGLPHYSAGTDSFSRADWNENVTDLDALVTIWLPPDTLINRPAFGVAGRLFRATDNGAVYLDTGAAWLELNAARSLGAAPAASAVGDAVAEGASTAAARADHRHAREAFGNVVASTVVGVAAANGAAGTVSRSDHVHGTPAGAAPGASAPGDAAAAGIAGTVARSDHVHAREAFAATAGIAALAAGIAGSAGVAPSVPRSDHVHPLAAGGPGVSVPGDAAAAGVSAAVARADHVHARESWAALRDTLIPAGIIAPYGGAAAPAGWLLCDGAVVAQANFPALFAAIGHSFGGDPGGGNFRLPEFRGRVPLGAGGGAYVRGTAVAWGSHAHPVTGGVSDTGLLFTGDQDRGHHHGVNINSGGQSANHTHDYPDYGGTDGGITRTTAGVSNDHVHNVAGNTGGASTGHLHQMSHGHGHGLGTAPANVDAAGLPVTFIIKAA